VRPECKEHVESTDLAAQELINCVKQQGQGSGSRRIGDDQQDPLSAEIVAWQIPRNPFVDFG
jgi:hypothetical protein